MTILETIVAQKKIEVAERKKAVPYRALDGSSNFSRTTHSLKASIKQRSPGVIAEFKHRSPSKGIINASADIRDVAPGYEKAGAAAISILTDISFFGGSFSELNLARSLVSIPLLQKDFVIDEYQVFEAKANGADAILLIAASLSEKQIIHLADVAHSAGLEVLIEVHDAQELQKSLHDSIDVVGVNNRNLYDFSVRIQTSYDLFPLIPSRFARISESALDNPVEVNKLMELGYDGFLIGEAFMKTLNPVEAFERFQLSL